MFFGNSSCCAPFPAASSIAKVRKCILCTTRFGQDRILEELAFMWEDYAVWNKVRKRIDEIMGGQSHK